MTLRSPLLVLLCLVRDFIGQRFRAIMSAGRVAATVLVGTAIVPALPASSLPRLEMSENRRFLVTEDGVPFFWQGDTAWELFHRLDRNEIDHYLRDRAAKRFNVVQCVLLAEADGLTVPNREGHVPFVELDPTRPNEAYFDLVDHAVTTARSLGIYLALLPTWGAHVEDRPHPLFENQHPFTPENARVYGRFLGKRYGAFGNVIWINGGDRKPTGNEAIWEAIAAGLREGDARGLMTYHVDGGASSSTYWHPAAWLDFNMIQSGHARVAARNWSMIARDYALTPPKPVIDGEPNYEALPIAFHDANPRFTDFDVRKAAYWAVFAGAFGHTYGHNSVWQMFRPGETAPILAADPGWRDALQAPGAGQMRHVRALMESRPYLTRIPAQDLTTNHGYDTDHAQITRDGTPDNNDATYIMVYLPYFRNLTVRTRVIAGERLRGWWYDPRTGAARLLGEIANTDDWRIPWAWRIRPREGAGPDWVLVLDDAAKNYASPGSVPMTP